jgi:hypothetical protein
VLLHHGSIVLCHLGRICLGIMAGLCFVIMTVFMACTPVTTLLGMLAAFM